jgi:hypothetical protein
MPKPKPTNLTPLEEMAYQSYMESEYLNEPGDAVWTFSVSDRFVQKGGGRAQFSGVVSQLSQKGVFAVQKSLGRKGDDDDMIWLR